MRNRHPFACVLLIPIINLVSCAASSEPMVRMNLSPQLPDELVLEFRKEAVNCIELSKGDPGAAWAWACLSDSLKERLCLVPDNESTKHLLDSMSLPLSEEVRTLVQLEIGYDHLSRCWEGRYGTSWSSVSVAAQIDVLRSAIGQNVQDRWTDELSNAYVCTSQGAGSSFVQLMMFSHPEYQISWQGILSVHMDPNECSDFP